MSLLNKIILDLTNFIYMLLKPFTKSELVNSDLSEKSKTKPKLIYNSDKPNLLLITDGVYKDNPKLFDDPSIIHKTTVIKQIELDNMIESLSKALGNNEWDNIGILIHGKYDKDEQTYTIYNKTMTTDPNLQPYDMICINFEKLITMIRPHTKDALHMFACELGKSNGLKLLLSKIDAKLKFPGGISVSTNNVGNLQLENINHNKQMLYVDKMTAVITSKAELKAEPNAKPKAEPNAEPKAEPNAEPKAKPKAEPKAESKAKPKAKANAKPNTNSVVIQNPKICKFKCVDQAIDEFTKDKSTFIQEIIGNNPEWTLEWNTKLGYNNLSTSDKLPINIYFTNTDKLNTIFLGFWDIFSDLYGKIGLNLIFSILANNINAIIKFIKFITSYLITILDKLNIDDNYLLAPEINPKLGNLDQLLIESSDDSSNEILYLFHRTSTFIRLLYHLNSYCGNNLVELDLNSSTPSTQAIETNPNKIIDLGMNYSIIKIGKRKYDTNNILLYAIKHTNSDKKINDLYICSRGTATGSEGLLDLYSNPISKRIPGNTSSNFFHEGLYKIYTDLIEFIKSMETEISNKTYNRIIFTGHSLGGGIISLICNDMINRINKLNIKVHISLLTFSSMSFSTESYNRNLTNLIKTNNDAYNRDKKTTYNTYALYNLRLKQDILPLLSVDLLKNRYDIDFSKFEDYKKLHYLPPSTTNNKNNQITIFGLNKDKQKNYIETKQLYNDDFSSDSVGYNLWSNEMLFTNDKCRIMSVSSVKNIDSLFTNGKLESLYSHHMIEQFVHPDVLKKMYNNDSTTIDNSYNKFKDCINAYVKNGYYK